MLRTPSLIVALLGALLLAWPLAEMPMLAAQVTPVATATATPEGDLTLTGRVYDAVSGAGISGANVAVTVCVPRSFAAAMWADRSLIRSR